MQTDILNILGALTWLGLLAVGTWTLKVIFERVLFHRTQPLARPVELTLCLARWRREHRLSAAGPARGQLGWLGPLVAATRSPRELLEQLHVLRTQVRRAGIQLQALGYLGSALGLFGTCLSLLQAGDSADRMAVIVLGVGTTVAGTFILGIAITFHSYSLSRYVELMPQIKETLTVVTELVLAEEDRIAEPRVAVPRTPSRLLPTDHDLPRKPDTTSADPHGTNNGQTPRRTG